MSFYNCLFETITLPDFTGQISRRYLKTAMGCWKSNIEPVSSACNIKTGAKQTAKLAGDILLHCEITIAKWSNK